MPLLQLRFGPYLFIMEDGAGNQEEQQRQQQKQNPRNVAHSVVGFSPLLQPTCRSQDRSDYTHFPTAGMDSLEPQLSVDKLN